MLDFLTLYLEAVHLIKNSELLIVAYRPFSQIAWPWLFLRGKFPGSQVLVNVFLPRSTNVNGQQSEVFFSIIPRAGVAASFILHLLSNVFSFVPLRLLEYVQCSLALFVLILFLLD